LETRRSGALLRHQAVVGVLLCQAIKVVVRHFGVVEVFFNKQLRLLRCCASSGGVSLLHLAMAAQKEADYRCFLQHKRKSREIFHICAHPRGWQQRRRNLLQKWR
jgi:hypothetical protein